MKKETGSRRMTKQLKLRKETLSLLEPTELQKIAGGESYHSFCAGTHEGCCQLN
jgi:hypothetical protein